MVRSPLISFFLAALVLGPPRADAWSGEVSQRIARDALRLVPRSLAELFLANDELIFSDAVALDARSLALVYADLPGGRLSVAAKQALEQDLRDCAQAFQGHDFRAAVISLGVAYRLVVDLADPAVGSQLGADSQGTAIRREFYHFVAAEHSRFPLVVAEPDSMSLRLEALPEFLGGVVARAASQSARLRAEGQEGGRVLLSSQVDFRSPVFALASTAYSRAASAVAATWIAVWRHAGGDMTRIKAPRIINPRSPR